MANPAGITCDGCGFVNASRATLTTGRPVAGSQADMQQGMAFEITEGALQINGQGLKVTDTNHVDLLARAIEINAQVWADLLNVVTGTARVARTLDQKLLTIKAEQNGGLYELKDLSPEERMALGMAIPGAEGRAGRVKLPVAPKAGRDGKRQEASKVESKRAVGVDAGPGVPSGAINVLEGVGYMPNIENHVVRFDGYTQKNGIHGSHNLENFLKQYLKRT